MDLDGASKTAGFVGADRSAGDAERAAEHEKIAGGGGDRPPRTHLELPPHSVGVAGVGIRPGQGQGAITGFHQDRVSACQPRGEGDILEVRVDGDDLIPRRADLRGVVGGDAAGVLKRAEGGEVGGAREGDRAAPQGVGAAEGDRAGGDRRSAGIGVRPGDKQRAGARKLEATGAGKIGGKRGRNGRVDDVVEGERRNAVDIGCALYQHWTVGVTELVEPRKGIGCRERRRAGDDGLGGGLEPRECRDDCYRCSEGSCRVAPAAADGQGQRRCSTENRGNHGVPPL